ncbi:hypothetical protein D3C86_1726160 [compost metagenome]
MDIIGVFVYGIMVAGTTNKKVDGVAQFVFRVYFAVEPVGPCQVEVQGVHKRQYFRELRHQVKFDGIGCRIFFCTTGCNVQDLRHGIFPVFMFGDAVAKVFLKIFWCKHQIRFPDIGCILKYNRNTRLLIFLYKLFIREIRSFVN